MAEDKEWTQKYDADLCSALATTSLSSSPRPDKSQSPAPPPAARSKPPTISISDTTSIPTPPSSPSPTSPSFHHSNPFSPSFRPARRDDPCPQGSQRPIAADSPRRPPSGAGSGGPQPRRVNSPPDHPVYASRSSRTMPSAQPPMSGPGAAGQSRPRRGSRPVQPTDGMSSPSSQKPTSHRSRKHRRGRSQPDTIDRMDTIGGGYHHDGPYDAALASRNVNSKYSPLAAVRDSNMEAIRATPPEFIQDSLRRHVPLQGTSTVPSGMAGLNGNIMNYEEGTDMMRDGNPGGGAYKRWDFMTYHPDDLKGKGEPSYTYERDLKARKRDALLHPEEHPGAIEMQAGRPRSKSSGVYESTSTAMPQRSFSNSRGLGSGLKRRLGSLRRKKDMPAEEVH